MEKEGGNRERMRKCRESISLHFLIFSPFPPHFLILSPFPRSQAATICANLAYVPDFNYTSNSPGDRGLRGCLCKSCQALQTQLEVEADPDRVADFSWPCASWCPWHRCLPLRHIDFNVVKSTNTKTNNAKNVNKSNHDRYFRPTNYNNSKYRAHPDITENDTNSNNCNNYLNFN